MANYEVVSVTTDNKKVFDILLEELQDDYFDMQLSKIEYNSMSFRNRQGNTVDFLQKLTAEHRDIPVTVTIAFESHRYERIYTLEVLNGEYTQLSVKEES